MLPGGCVFLGEPCTGDLGWCGAVRYRVHVIGLVAGGLAGNGFVGLGVARLP